jgi:hypothetical protein
MKKKIKKLVLAKETVRNLEESELGRVDGGLSANTDCTYTNCCSGYNTCGTCGCGTGTTGGTRLC